MSKPVVAITRPKDRAKKACEIVEKKNWVEVQFLHLHLIWSLSTQNL